MKKRHIVVNDTMQSDYAYDCTEPVGQNFHVDFCPDLSPKAMLQLGIFGGKYMTDCRQEFPRDWYAKAKLAAGYRDPNLNWFGVDASQSLSVWRQNGWIYGDDPRGWFQWYCRYYLGRRSRDDKRQIKRWRAMRRHVAQVTKGCERYDFSCRPKQRQALLHWAYDSRQF